MGNRIYLYAERQGEYEMLSEAKYEVPPVWCLLLGDVIADEGGLTLRTRQKASWAALNGLLGVLEADASFSKDNHFLQALDAVRSYLAAYPTKLTVELAELFMMEADISEADFLSQTIDELRSFRSSCDPFIANKEVAGLNQLFGVETAADWLSQTGLTWWEDAYFWESRWEKQSWADYQSEKATAPVPLGDGLTAFYADGQWGLRDEDGAVLASPFADELLPFDDEVAVTGYRQGLHWGLLHRSGRVVTPAEFDVYEGIHGGIAIVQVAGRFGLLELDGQWLATPQFDDAYGFDEGLAPVSLNGKWGMLGRDGKVVIPIELDDLHSASLLKDEQASGVRLLAKQGGWGLMDEGGRWVLPPVYDAIEWKTGHAAGWQTSKDNLLGRLSPLGETWLAGEWHAIEALPLDDQGKQLAWLVEKAGLKGVVGNDGHVWLPCQFDKLKPLEAVEATVRPGCHRFWEVAEKRKSFVWDMEAGQSVLSMNGLKKVLPLIGDSAVYLLGVDKEQGEMRFYSATGKLMFPYQFQWLHDDAANPKGGWHWKGVLYLHCLVPWATGEPVEAMIGKPLSQSATFMGSVWLFADGQMVSDVDWQLPKANAGEAEACYRMAGHVENTDLVAARAWLQKAAAQGHEAAIAEYAYSLTNELAGPVDLVRARQLYESVLHRFPWAQNNFASMLQNGEGGPKDEKRAFELFRWPAERGIVVAMRNLGEAFCYGYGTSIHLPSAISWLEKAAECGDSIAARQAAALLISNHQATDTPLQKQKRQERAYRWAYMAVGDEQLASLLVLADVLFASGTPEDREEAKRLLLARQAEQPDPAIQAVLDANGWGRN
ncbi:SEL1-like repeat protein [Leeia sp. TBRC 13508]|uniref:SEL1-like repeat protein n=1 Tax=Leeia speluncae TaxID=2884804 RepID=A0ABS8D402_9NEIS|nr:SEL1-like repeat protein [Leeia speluncae]MCB6182918.1 SEL1-like repeat protein [Leeia speluncae]